MKQILIIALAMTAANVQAQNNAVPVAPASIVVIDNTPATKNASPPEIKLVNNPVTLPLQKSMPMQQAVVLPVTQNDEPVELKAVAVGPNTQKGIKPVNMDRPKTSTLLNNKAVEPTKPTAIVVQLQP